MIHEALQKISAGVDLSRAEADGAMEQILSGRATDPQILELLSALQIKGETVEELVGFATAMRRHATKIFPSGYSRDDRALVDTCGTGGDAKGTFNVSTAAAFVVAGAGVHVAKHGNRSISSRCGSADVLEALGVRTAVGPEVVARAIREAGIGFLFAPSFHGATRNVQPVRIELRMRTAFNFLGPLTNPARAEIQVAGTWSDEAAEKIAGAMARLGSHRGYVVHGSDGLGELTITGPSTVFAIQYGGVSRTEVSPRDFGLRPQSLDGIQGGDI